MPPSGDLLSPIERVRTLDTVRRIERDQNAQEFGQKEQGSNQNRRNTPHSPASDEEPQDVVDVSSDYHATETAPALKDAVSSADPSPIRSQPPPDSEHHLDIKV